jgi:hypothetical protein
LIIWGDTVTPAFWQRSLTVKSYFSDPLKRKWLAPAVFRPVNYFTAKKRHIDPSGFL